MYGATPAETRLKDENSGGAGQKVQVSMSRRDGNGQGQEYAQSVLRCEKTIRVARHNGRAATLNSVSALVPDRGCQRYQYPWDGSVVSLNVCVAS